MLSLEWLRAFVPVGILRGAREFVAAGAGVLIHHPPLVWLVTANHVVSKPEGRIAVLVPGKDDRIGLLDVSDLHSRQGLKWLVDSDADIAATPFPLSGEMRVKAVSERNCILLSAVVPSMGTYTVGCPYGIRGVDPERVTPLVLSGIVSGVSTHESMTYTSAPTFPGNSGGPLLVVQAPFTPEGGMIVGRSTIFLGGIMREMALVRGDNDSLPALHLGIATSVDRVWGLLKGKEAAELVARLQ